MAAVKTDENPHTAYSLTWSTRPGWASHGDGAAGIWQRGLNRFRKGDLEGLRMLKMTDFPRGGWYNGPMRRTCDIVKTLIALQREARLWPSKMRLGDELCTIESRLKDAGARSLGKGAFATVYGMGKCAIKVVLTRENRAYMAFARHCQRSPGPMVPTIHRLVRVRRYTMVVMETLEDRQDLAVPMARSFYQLLRRNRGSVGAVSRVVGRRQDQLHDRLWRISGILQKHPRSDWDLHSGNILFRQERGRPRMVIADPIIY